MDAASARLLRLIRRFDDEGGWNNGFRSCAEWLAWRTGLEPGARYSLISTGATSMPVALATIDA